MVVKILFVNMLWYSMCCYAFSAHINNIIIILLPSPPDLRPSPGVDGDEERGALGAPQRVLPREGVPEHLREQPVPREQRVLVQVLRPAKGRERTGNMSLNVGTIFISISFDVSNFL